MRAPLGLRWALTAVLILAATRASAAAQESWYLAARNNVETGLGILIVSRDDGTRWVRVLDLSLLEIAALAGPRSSHAGEALVAVESIAAQLVLDETGGRAHFLDRNAAHPLPDLGATELLLDVAINQQPLAGPQLARFDDGDLLLSPDTLRQANIDLEAIGSGADEWVPLHALAGENFVLDPQRLQLSLTVAPEAFVATRLQLDRSSERVPAPAPAPLAAIIGYDVNAGRSADGSTWQTALADIAVSKGRTSCRSRHAWRSQEGSIERLDSACIIDWPERALSVTLGDAISRGAALGAPVRYGGIRVGTDFSLQPYLYTQPLLDMSGEARLPSVLEVWIEHQLALRTEVPAGPFLLDSIPALSGRGEVEAVVIDALGRRTVVSAPFYSDPSFLRAGLSDWAIELGFPRAGLFGGADHYADPFTLGSLRRGMTDNLTLELRGEVREGGGALGSAALWNLGGYGVLEAGAAQSVFDGVHGAAYQLGYSYHGQRWNVGMRRLQRDAGYSDVGFPVPGTAPASESQFGFGMRLGRASVQLGAVEREKADGSRDRLATATMSMQVGSGYLSASAIKSLVPPSPTEFSATYTLPLDMRSSVATSARHDERGTSTEVAYRLNPPPGPGYGLNAVYRSGAGADSALVDGTVRGDLGRASALLVSDGSDVDARVGASGAVLLTGSGVFMAPDDGGSFAVVSLPAANARVLVANQVAGRSDARGRALITRLRPFERNHLSMMVEDIPMNTRMVSPDLQIVPGRRQVVEARFGAEEVRYLVVTLQRSDGSPVPMGATAMLGDRSWPVGHDGLLFAELGEDSQDIVVQWNQAESCIVAAGKVPASPEPSETHLLVCEE